MNFNNIIFFDFETGSVNPYRCQPIQLAAVAIDGRRMEILPDGYFSSYIKPIFDKEECERCMLDGLEQEALLKNNIQESQLIDAPGISVVWSMFRAFVKRYNTKDSKWTNPIAAGFNNNKFDDIIVNRICGGHLRHVKVYLDHLKQLGIVTKKDVPIKEPYGLGPWNDSREENSLFHPIDNIDLIKVFVWPWTENMSTMTSQSFDAIRDWLGISREGAHNAIKDVNDGAEVLIRYMRLIRSLSPRVIFTNSFAKESNVISLL